MCSSTLATSAVLDCSFPILPQIAGRRFVYLMVETERVCVKVSKS